MADRIAGTCYVNADGFQIALAGTCTVDRKDTEKTGMTGLSGNVGYSEKPRVPSIEVEFFHTRQTSVDSILDMEDGTVTAELANGKVWTLRNAYVQGAPTVDAEESKMTVKFEGLSCELSSG